MRKRENLRKKLTKSSSNRVLAGVLGGLAEYLHMKPNVLRVIYLVVTALTSFIPGIVVYLMLAVLMPDDPRRVDPWQNFAHFFGQGNQSKHQHSARKELHDVEEKDL